MKQREAGGSAQGEDRNDPACSGALTGLTARGAGYNQRVLLFEPSGVPLGPVSFERRRDWCTSPRADPRGAVCHVVARAAYDMKARAAYDMKLGQHRCFALLYQRSGLSYVADTPSLK